MGGATASMTWCASLTICSPPRLASPARYLAYPPSAWEIAGVEEPKNKDYYARESAGVVLRGTSRGRRATAVTRHAEHCDPASARVEQLPRRVARAPGHTWYAREGPHGNTGFRRSS